MNKFKELMKSEAIRLAMEPVTQYVGWGKVILEIKDGKILMSKICFEIDVKHTS